MKGFLLDTHAWLWAQLKVSNEVSPHFFSEVEHWQAQGEAFVSAISVLEIARLSEAGRIHLGSTVDAFIEEGTEDDGLKLLPLTNRILIESTRLAGDIHRDPSDRLLVATALEHGLTLVTRDKRLLDYAKQGYLNARKP